MPDRVSLIEQYDNRDVIAQIYRIINIAEHGAIEALVATKKGSSVKLIFTMHDGTKHEITFESNGVKDVYAVQHGSTEIVYVKLDDDTVRMFSFDIAIAGVTTDTEQTITARKTFTAPQTFSGGIEGTTMIDGEVQISNGHSLSVAGDIDTAGDMQVAGNAEFLGNVEAGGMAIEESNGRTILSNSNGISVEGQVSLDAMTVAGMAISKSEDRATILDNDDPIIVPHTLEVATNLTGTRDSQAVNGTRLQNDLDNYPQMLRLTGNQTSTGLKEGNWSMYRMEKPNGVNNGKWLRYCEMDTSFSLTLMEFIGQHGNNGYCYARAIVSGTQTFTRVFPIDNVPCNSGIKIVCGINRTTLKMEVWIYQSESVSVRNIAVSINQPDKRNAVYLNEEYDDAPTNDNYNGLNYILGSE